MLEALALTCATIRLTDGDTFWCDQTKVRLVAASGAVDAPDSRHSPRCKPGGNGWCDDAMAEKAKRRLGQLIVGTGAVMSCNGYDKYRRALCTVSVRGRDVGDQLVAEGLAVVRDDWR